MQRTRTNYPEPQANEELTDDLAFLESIESLESDTTYIEDLDFANSHENIQVSELF